MTARQIRSVDPFADWKARASGLYVPPKRQRDRPIAIDLFCGAGGFSLGFIQAGYEVVAGADHDADAMLTYLTNLGTYPTNIVFIEPEDRERAEKALLRNYKASGWCDRRGDWTNQLTDKGGRGPLVSGGERPEDQPGVGTFFLGDIRKLSGDQILRVLGLERGEVDAVIGGPPCQGFSMGGKRDVMDPRNSLVFDFARLILEINPKTFVMENVPGLLSMVTPEGIPVLDAFCHVISDGGFGSFDALKKSLLASSGAGAVVKSHSPEPPSRDPDNETTQASLWEAL